MSTAERRSFFQEQWDKDPKIFSSESLELIRKVDDLLKMASNIKNDLLLFACHTGKPNFALEIIKLKGPSLLNQVDEEKNNALILACRNKMIEVAGMLWLTGDFDFSHRNNTGFTAFHYSYSDPAMEAISADIIINGTENVFTRKYLAKVFRSAYVTKQNLLFRCLMITFKNYSNNLVPWDNILITAIEDKQCDIALEVVKNTNIEFDSVNNDNKTSLILALENGLEDVGLEIIKRGNFGGKHVDNDDNTALSIAIERNMVPIVTALILENNSDYGHIKNDRTVLMIACEKKLDRIAIELIKTKRANIMYINDNEKEALSIAKENNLYDVMECLKDFSKVESDDNCCICYEKIMKRIALEPCGHANICVSCHLKTNNSCPICRKVIRSIMYIYL